MTSEENSPAGTRPTYLVAHPGAELFGSDRMVLESVRGLVASSARVIVALPENGPLVPELIGAGAEVVILPVLVLRKSLIRPRGWSTLLRQTFRGLGAGWRLLARVRPDAVYVSTITIPQWPLIARLRGVPVVSHVHEAEASGSRLINALLYLPHLVAQRILVNSRFSLATIVDALPLAARRASVLYNGVSGPQTAHAPRASIDELRVLYVGRLSPRKGVEDVIAAADALSARGVPVRVSILGSAFPGYEWFDADLRDRGRASQSTIVEFLGFKPDVWDVIAEADVVVVPSRVDEPFGNTAVEGILAHRPVIASDTSGLREAAGGYSTTFLFPPGDVRALADAMHTVRENWDALRDDLAVSATVAELRHSPSRYREEVASAVEHAHDRHIQRPRIQRPRMTIGARSSAGGKPVGGDVGR